MSAPLRQEWFSASELAGLPGMPGRRNKVLARARSADWRSREIPVAGARGVGLEFHISSLPPETQAELARRAALLEHPAALTAAYRAGSELAEALRPTTARATTSPVSSDQQPVSTPAAERRSAIARARLELLRQRDAFCASSGLAKAEAAAVFAAGYSEGRIEVASEVRALIPRVSVGGKQGDALLSLGESDTRGTVWYLRPVGFVRNYFANTKKRVGNRLE